MHSWTRILPRLSLGLAVLGAAGVAYAELGDPATSTPACCTLTTSLVNDVIRGKDSSGDERFFASDGAPPNIHFLVDLSSSMRELPQVINSTHSEFFNITINGCQNPRLDAFETSRGWNASTAYPIPDPGTGIGSDNGFPDLFRDDKFYGYMYWNDSSSPSWQWDNKEQACQQQVPYWDTSGAATYTQCLTCLSTKGYWKLPTATQRDTAPFQNRDFIFWGRFLNFNPPKYVTAKAVMKQVIKDLRRVRAGISVFTTTTTLTSMVKGQNPSCKQIINDASSFDSNRASYIDAVNGWSFTTGTPLAKSLLNVGYYFTSDDTIYRNVFNFGSNYAYPSEFANGSLSSENRSVCWGCQTSSVIIITDGEPSGDSFTATMADRLRTVNGGPVYCPDSKPCNSGTSNSTRDKGTNGGAYYTDDNPNFYLDDVAKMLYEKDLQASVPPVVGDLNTGGKQSVITYTVGFGTNSNLLQNTADVGGGLYYTADDAASLKQALLEIINNVQTRATSFSSAAAATLQVHGASAAIIPRFKPARSKTKPWQGLVYRFNLWNEQVEPCTPKGAGDKNNDGDCMDTVMIDKSGDAVLENDDGTFVKLLDPLTPAVPFWEAGNMLKDPTVANTQGWQSRKIYTAIDTTGDGRVDFQDTPVPFDEAHASQLREYLGISQNPNACADIAAIQGVASLTPDDCARAVIRWYRGADELNPDPAKRAYDRDFLLGDIFHSSPASASPPMPRNFCAFSTQCLQSLFSGATLQQSDYTIGTATGVSAYEKYVDVASKRDELTLVGANDGMLHAFITGVSTGVKDSFTSQIKHDEGTGKEAWAFIPPDLLPKLRANIGKHAYFVDSTAMVRDVWIDGVGGGQPDGKKQWQEYRTVAVVGTGRGGVHRFALDLTRLLGTNPNDTQSLTPDKGDFLWMWPQPCDPLALQVGESFSNFAPRSPPIGPLALSPEADDALRSMYGPAGGSPESPYKINNAPARERYVVFLNGGYDQSMTRGRGVAIVDIRSGHTVWSFFNGDGKKRSNHLLYPIGAGMNMADLGAGDNPSTDGDYLFDTAAVGDYGGQLWTIRFWQPGTWDSSKKQVNNWYAARGFRVENLAGNSSDPDAMRAPFSYTALSARQPETGFWRVFLGTGDRDNQMDKGTVCRLSNPRACAVQGCGVNNTVTVKRGGTTVMTTNATYQNYHYSSGTTTALDANSSLPNSCGTAEVTLQWDGTAANGCGNGSDGSIVYTCDGGDPTKFNCRETQNDWTVLNYTGTSPYPQRYYGIYAYGGTNAKRKFDSDTEADTYEANMLKDSDLVDVSQFDASGVVIDTAQQSASPLGNGWRIQYSATNERTGSTGVLLNGCVLWNSFEPSGASGAVCATTGTNVARTYQANYTTGRADCSVGFYNATTHQWARYIPSTVTSSASEPTLQVGIGNGQIVRGTVTLAPGSSPQGITTNVGEEGVKSLYQIELDRRGHDCRHGGTNCK